MQPVTDGPRSALATSDVLDLLTTSSSVQIKSGLEAYDSTLTFKADLSGNLQTGCSVSSDISAAIHRTCNLVLDTNAPFNYLSDYVKPYVVLTDTVTQFSARFNLGVYTLATPTPDLTLGPGQSSYTGYDLLQILNQPIGNSYELASGSNPVDAAKALILVAFPAATFGTDTSTATTTYALSWPLDSSNQFTYLTVVNNLLQLAGFLPVWVDWDGKFQLRLYKDPADTVTSPVEWEFDLATDTGVVGASRSMLQDLYDVPNLWVYVMNNLDTAPVEGVTQFTYTDNSSPATGVPARGRVVRKVVFVDAVDYATLAVVAAAGIEADLRTVEAFAINTFPIPLFWHRDIATYSDPSVPYLTGGGVVLDPGGGGGPHSDSPGAFIHPPVGGSVGTVRRVMVTSWTLPLDVVSGDMNMTLGALYGATTSAIQG